MKAKHQRLILALVAVAALIGAGLLAASALRDEAAYFYTPADAKMKGVEPGKAVTLGKVRPAPPVVLDANLERAVPDRQGHRSARSVGMLADVRERLSDDEVRGGLGPEAEVLRNIRDDDTAWMPFTTTKESGFDRFERCVKAETGNFYEFRSATGGWLLLVDSRFVAEWGRTRPGGSG